MRVVALDHIVLVTADPERLIGWYRETLGLQPQRLEAWRRGEVPFASLRVSDSTIIDVLSGERTGANMEHLALVVDGVDLDALAAEHGVSGPKDLFGARGQGRGIYLRDPDGNGVELRSYG
ncbi:VOC family protein [Pseudonocardia acidicola]|uniref:VOC family protein n=1 Tax=Pseudonocardia acidicola TaxID=2724939 RepID=A0ABX1SCR9_9PSEU|nr:VOC family protein [Pseudonocardia acidicola]NMH99350.1 VOC family protein [Pseudonocardia acidicola]